MANSAEMPPLGKRGREFWESTLGKYSLSDSEMAILTEAARAMDTLDWLDAYIRKHGATVTKPTGEEVPNPCINVAKGQREILHRMLASLALPDVDGTVVPNGHTLRGRTGATARWATARRSAQRAG